MAWSRMNVACAAVAAAAACRASVQLTAFMLPSGGAPSAPRAGIASAGAAPAGAAAGAAGGSWGAAAVAVVAGAHLGLALTRGLRRGTAVRAEKKEVPAKPAKYVESALDKKLFEKVYMEYTAEYLKGPMYWHEDKLQGYLPDYPGEPMFKPAPEGFTAPPGSMWNQEGRERLATSNVTGNLKTFSSAELGYLSVLFFAIGLYGNLKFLVYDPQWALVDAGQNFKVDYIVEALLLPMSFFMHIAAWIQKQNGK